MSECENCNEPYIAGGDACEKCTDVASSGNSDLLYTVEMLEFILSDEGGLVTALNKGCKQMGATTAPIVALFRARECLCVIKKELGI